MSYFGRGWQSQSGPTPRHWDETEGAHGEYEGRPEAAAAWRRGSQPPPRWRESAPAPYRGSYGTFMQRYEVPRGQYNDEGRDGPSARDVLRSQGGGHSHGAGYGHGQASARGWTSQSGMRMPSGGDRGATGGTGHDNMGYGQRPTGEYGGGRGLDDVFAHPRTQMRMDERGRSLQYDRGLEQGRQQQPPGQHAREAAGREVVGGGHGMGRGEREEHGRHWVRGGDADRGRSGGSSSGYQRAAARVSGARGASMNATTGADEDEEQERQLRAQLAEVQARRREKSAREMQARADDGWDIGDGGHGGDRGGGERDEDHTEAMFDDRDDDGARAEMTGGDTAGGEGAMADGEAAAGAASTARRAREMSPEPAPERAGAEPSWSDRHLYWLSSDARHTLAKQPEVSFNAMAPSDRPTDIWPPQDLLHDLAMCAEDSTDGEPPQFAKMRWGAGETAQRGLVMLRATTRAMDDNQRASVRVMDEEWVCGAKNELLEIAPWLEAIVLDGDVRWPTHSVAERGAKCTATKLARRVLWLECALRLLLVAGNGTDSDWDEAMKVDFGERRHAQEDLTDLLQLEAAGNATITRAYTVFVGGMRRMWDAHAIMRPDDEIDRTRKGVWEAWTGMAEEYELGVFSAGSKHAARKDAYERSAHGVGIRGSESVPGDMMVRTAPLPAQGAVTGDLYVARTSATNADMQAILAMVAEAKTSEWAKAVTDMCSFGTPKGRALELVLNAVAPGLTAEQRAARMCQSGVAEGAVVPALRGTSEERSKRMGWACDIRSGNELRKAVEGRVRRIVAEEQHTGAGRSSEERSPAKAKRRTEGTAASGAGGAYAMRTERAASAAGSDEPGRGWRGEADAAAGSVNVAAMTMDEFDDEPGNGGARIDYDGGGGGGGDNRAGVPEPPRMRRQRWPPRHEYMGQPDADDDDKLTRTIAAVMDGQQAAKYGLDSASAADLTRFGHLQPGQQPTMGMTMAAREVLPTTGAVTQHQHIDADIAMMGAPAGLAKHVTRVQTLMRFGEFYPPKAQLTMLLKGMTSAESGFAPLMFQRVVGVEDKAKQIATQQVEATDA